MVNKNTNGSIKQNNTSKDYKFQPLSLFEKNAKEVMAGSAPLKKIRIPNPPRKALFIPFIKLECGASPICCSTTNAIPPKLTIVAIIPIKIFLIYIEISSQSDLVHYLNHVSAFIRSRDALPSRSEHFQVWSALC